MGKKREYKTEAELRKQVEEEIPYVVGKGTQCVVARGRRLKELFRRHGHPVNDAPGVEGSFGGEGFRLGSRSNNVDTGDNAMVTTSSAPHFRGQRIA